jgi:hypothetical protein
MNLLRFLKRSQFRPAWQYNVKKLLWQVHTGSPEYLVGEDRDPEGRRATFFCLDRATGKPAWEWLNPGDAWWIGIEAVEGTFALFHGFASPDMPIHKGLTVVDLGSGRVLWSNPEVRFLTLRATSVLVLKESLERGVCLELDLLTGLVLKECSDSDKGASSGVVSPHPGSSRAEFPHPVGHNDLSQPESPRAIREILPANVVEGSAFVLLSNGFFVVSYCVPTSHRPEETSTVYTVLRVLRQSDGVPMYADRTSVSAAVMMAEPFFVQNGVLYYVKQRSTLVAVPLHAA